MKKEAFVLTPDEVSTALIDFIQYKKNGGRGKMDQNVNPKDKPVWYWLEKYNEEKAKLRHIMSSRDGWVAAAIVSWIIMVLMIVKIAQS